MIIYYFLLSILIIFPLFLFLIVINDRIMFLIKPRLAH